MRSTVSLHRRILPNDVLFCIEIIISAPWIYHLAMFLSNDDRCRTKQKYADAELTRSNHGLGDVLRLGQTTTVEKIARTVKNESAARSFPFQLTLHAHCIQSFPNQAGALGDANSAVLRRAFVEERSLKGYARTSIYAGLFHGQ